MKELFLLVAFLMSMLFFVSCDQSDNIDDKWNSKEVYSLTAKTRSTNVEPMPIMMTYILPGQEKLTYTIPKTDAEIDFDISWPGGFTFEPLKLTIDYNIRNGENCIITDFYISNKTLSSYKATFNITGTVIDTLEYKTTPFINEISLGVQSEEREVMNPNK